MAWIFATEASVLAWGARQHEPAMRRLAIGPAATMFGLFTIQSLTHNNGILYGQQGCLLIAGLVLAAAWYQARDRAAGTAP